MHFKTLVLAGLTSLAAVAALPSASRHDSPMVARNHRFIRPRKADPVSSKVKRCAATSSSASEAAESTPASAEYTPAEAGNVAAKPTTTPRTRSAKFVTSTVKGSTKTQSETQSDPAAPTAVIGGGTGGISISDKLLAVFPGGTANGMPKWSTNPAVSGAFALSDKALGATSVITRLSHPVVNYAGKQAMKISFQQGAVAYRSKALGGVSFYALGPSTQRIDNAKVLTFSYSINFQEGFDFNKGGKLPGLYGGTSEDEARGCSGGNTRPTCWSARFMWREKGAGELYGYLPSDAKPTNKAAVCSKTNTSCDLGYGWSLGRDTWEWTPGSWQTIAQKVTLNDIGKANGSIIVYMNGKQVYSASNIMLRTKKNAMPRGVMFQSFFGGHDPSWASPKDQELHIADLSVAVLETE